MLKTDKDSLVRYLLIVTIILVAGAAFAVFFEKVFPELGAVSYTHLDVYKRQVEGCTVQTKYGPVKSDFILFIAAGAFSMSKPSDLIPELQGRFPIRVNLENLTRDDLRRILLEPEHSLIEQYLALLSVDGVDAEFTDEGIDALAEIADRVNENTENIGARRLHTILEKVLEDLLYDAPEAVSGKVIIDRQYIESKLKDIVQDEDLSRFIL